MIGGGYYICGSFDSAAEYFARSINGCYARDVWLQPRGIFRAMFSSENNYSKKGFCAELAANMGTICRPSRELRYIPGELKTEMARPPPVYFEDSATGLGHCAICDKRGVLGRCQSCGLLLHHSCAAPELPGRALQKRMGMWRKKHACRQFMLRRFNSRDA